MGVDVMSGQNMCILMRQLEELATAGTGAAAQLLGRLGCVASSAYVCCACVFGWVPVGNMCSAWLLGWTLGLHHLGLLHSAAANKGIWV